MRKYRNFALFLLLAFVLVARSRECAVFASTPPVLYLSGTATITAVQGGSSSNSYKVTTGGSFSGLVTLTCAGLPSGVTASWSLSSFTPAVPSSITYSTLTFQVASSVKPGWYGYTVTAAGDGLSVQWAYALIVNQAGGVNASVSATTFSMESMGSTTLNVIATPVGGVSTTTALTKPQIVGGLPTGVTATWGIPAISPAGVVTCPLSLAGSTAAVGGTSSLQFSVTVTDKNTGISYSATTNSSLTIYFNTPSLQLSAASTKSVLLPGQSISDVFTVKTAGSFHGAISLSVAGLPSGVTATWSQSSFTPSSATSTTTSTLTFNVPSSVQPSWYLYSVTAVGDGLSVTWTFGLVVEPAVGMGLAVSTITPMVNAGQSTAMTVTIVPKNGITVASGSPTASITSTLPAGITATFGTPVTNSNGSISWTLTLSASSSAAIGDVPFTLQAGITDTVSGEPYSLSQQLNLLVSTLATIVPNTTAGSPMPAGFLGLYNEWWCAQNVMGSTATGVNTVYRKLISNLTAYNTGTLNYRVGGDSTDKTTEPISTTAVPFAQLSAAVPVDFDLGVNLGSDNVALAVDQANAYISQMPTGSLQYIEIGNEPNFYASHGLRSPSYTYTDYLADDTNWNDHLTPVLPPGVKLMGPAWSTYQSPADAATFLANQPSAFGAYSIHYYAAASTPVPAADYLLTSAAATTLPSNVAGSVPEVHAAGAVYRIDEIGTQSGAGTAGLSNGFQSALWSLDVMFGLAQVGVDGVNWQTSPGNVSAPFVFNVTAVTSTTNSYALQSVSPLYYGLLLFQQATANQAKLVPVTVTTGANVTAWATLDSTEDEERVVILNKDEANSGKVALNAPGYTSATVTRLLAPSYSSTSGVTLGGQTFDGSSDGSIQGTLTQETYTSSNGQFEINMPTVSGAMVVLKP